MSRIVVPTDGSDLANQAIPWAKVLTDKTQAQLELFRTYHPLASVYSYPDFATPPPVPYDLSGFARHATKHLEVVAKEYDVSGAKLSVQEGDAAESICRLAAADDVAMVVLTSHGRSGLGRWLLGSVTNQVVRACTKPVLIVKAQDTPVAPAFERILVPLDGSELGEEALEHAKKLALLFGSKLHLLRCVDFTPYPMANIQVALHYEIEESEKYLESLTSRLEGIEVTAEVKAVSAIRGILEASKQNDLIVLSTHGAGGFERWLVGSVTDKVINRASTPVLVICHGEQ